MESSWVPLPSSPENREEENHLNLNIFVLRNLATVAPLVVMLSSRLPDYRPLSRISPLPGILWCLWLSRRYSASILIDARICSTPGWVMGKNQAEDEMSCFEDDFEKTEVVILSTIEPAFLTFRSSFFFAVFLQSRGSFFSPGLFQPFLAVRHKRFEIELLP